MGESTMLMLGHLRTVEINGVFFDAGSMSKLEIENTNIYTEQSEYRNDAELACVVQCDIEKFSFAF